MANYVKFYDAIDITINPIEVKDVKTATQSGALLIVKIAATHSGKITRNNGFYLPHKMHLGTSSFTDQYPKPIQVHHNTNKDPIGRVLKAVYVDISGESSTLFDSDIVDFVNGNLSLEDSFDAAIKLINNTTLTDNKDYEGLGYIELTAEITDQDAIQKIRDKRYLTGSTGASTNKAICSVCKKDWSESGRCVHKPGQLYNGKKCVIIAGDLTYDEYSFVNKPADRHSRIIEVCVDGVQDFLDLDKIEEIIISDKKPEEDVAMTFKDAFELASKQDRFRTWSTLVDHVKKIIEDNKELTEDSLVLLLAEIQDKEQVPLTTDTVDPEEQKLRDFYGDAYDDMVNEDSWGRNYAEMMLSLMEDATEENKEELKAFVLDAKLSTTARKKLASSTFCGPDRSFPVNDCAHYTAALRLIGRYTGPGDKDRIRACVERKGKRLSCGSKSAKDFVKPQADLFTVAYFDNFTDEEIVALNISLQDSLVERNLATAIVVEDSKKELDILKKQIKYLYADIDNLTDALADVIGQLKDSHIQQISNLKLLSKDTENFTDFVAALNDKTSEETKQVLSELSKQVDIQKIVDTLSSGLSNVPNTQVADPTIVVDNLKPSEKVEETEKKNKIDDRSKRLIMLEWRQRNINNGTVSADKWLDKIAQSNGYTIDDFKK